MMMMMMMPFVVVVVVVREKKVIVNYDLCQVFFDFTIVCGVYEKMKQARMICREMIEQRGYTINDVDDNDPHRRRLFAEHDKSKDRLCVFFCNKIDKSCSRYVIESMDSLHISHSILVYLNLTPQGRNTIQCQKDKWIELFTVRNMQFNPTKHTLVPLHKKTKKKLLVRANFDLTQFPKIKSTDPIVKFCGFRVGDVISITRKTGDHVYRIVVD